MREKSDNGSPERVLPRAIAFESKSCIISKRMHAVGSMEATLGLESSLRPEVSCQSCCGVSVRALVPGGTAEGFMIRPGHQRIVYHLSFCVPAQTDSRRGFWSVRQL